MTGMKKRVLAFYKNGNYTVRLFCDGTKIKTTAEDSFRADFPDSIDLKITDYCDLACPMCHECSSTSGGAGELSAPFFGTLHAGTELAIGGGNPLSHPQLLPFLEGMRERGIVCNLTVNGAHLLRERACVASLLDRRLIHGLGISLAMADEEVIAFARQYETSVLHLICGVFEDYERLFDKGLKILFLGYKRFGRGELFYSDRVERNLAFLKADLHRMTDRFECIAFDNLALEQLDVRALVSEADYERMFMGNDGEASMYIDLVKREFAKSSTARERFPLREDIVSMFRTFAS